LQAGIVDSRHRFIDQIQINGRAAGDGRFRQAQGMTADEIRTSAAVSGSMDGGGFTITNVHLTVEARIPGADDAAFQEAADTACKICPVSKLLNAEITLDAKLVG
jgi:osmotically inducible protein OsmC